MIFTIFHGKSHYRNDHFQENRKHHIKDEFVGIREIAGYRFCDFPSKMANLRLKTQILIFLGIKPNLNEPKS